MEKKTPRDPMVRDLVALAKNARMNRRGLLKAGAAGAAGLSALGLSACSTGPQIDRGDGSKGSVVWANWTLYLDYDKKKKTFPTLDAFMKDTNIKVTYLEDIDDNNTFYAKVKDELELGKPLAYDAVTFSDWMCGRLIHDKQVQKFDHGNIPNIKNLLPSMANSLDLDKGRHYTIPWQGPTTGIAWNKEAVPDGIHVLDDLLKPEFKGKVGVLSEMRDTVGTVMLAQGVDLGGEWGDTEFDRAIEWLDDAMRSGQIATVKGNSYTQDLEKGSTLVQIAWSGDVATLNAEQGDQWAMSPLESGGLITADSFSIPNGTPADKKKNIEELIDYYYQPEVAAEVADYVWYVTPVVGAQEAMRKFNPENADNPYIFPDDEMLSKLHGFRTLTPQEEKKYTKQFSKVMGL